MKRTSYLALQNGVVFKGKGFGAEKDVVAEVVFTTGMTGYLETLTDRSYYGQIVVQTFPLIGNYGVIPDDFESDNFFPEAYIVRQWCEVPSNFRSRGDIDTFFNAQGIAGLYDIDTRALTKVIRENGVMNGIVTSNLQNIDINVLNNYKIKNAIASVSTNEIKTYGNPSSKNKVVLMDYGLKNSILKKLLNRDCEVIVCPYDTSPEEIKSLSPSGIVLSNGPGDPRENEMVYNNIRILQDMKFPIFGICLGHQLLALANGFETKKLKYGHRGANQPVKNLETGRVYISSQNHGYAVESDSIDKSKAKEYFVNANDGTNEGIVYSKTPTFSVQFHPEACGGPQDTGWLFNRFLDLMEGM